MDRDELPIRSAGMIDPGTASPALTPPRSRPGPANSASTGRLTSPLQCLQQVSYASPFSAGKVSDSVNSSTPASSVLRYELEQIESRLASQVARVRDGATASLEKADRTREAAQQRLDQKILVYEASQAGLDRKMSELAGSVRGLSDEAQEQIKRVDSFDAKIWELRHQMEDKLAHETAELQRQQQEVLSKCRVMLCTSDDGQKRLERSLQRLEDRVQHLANDVASGLEALEESVTASHVQNEAKLAVAPEETAALQSCEEETRLWKAEQLLADLSQKLGRFESEAYGERGWEYRFQQHEVGISVLRSKLEGLGGVVRACAENTKVCREITPVRDEQSRTRPLEITEQSPGREQAHIEAELRALRADCELAPRVSTLVSQLKDIVPKVIEHGDVIRHLQAVHLRGNSTKEEAADLQRRILRLERAAEEQAAALQESLAAAAASAASAAAAAAGAELRAQEGLDQLLENRELHRQLMQQLQEVRQLREEQCKAPPMPRSSANAAESSEKRRLFHQQGQLQHAERREQQQHAVLPQAVHLSQQGNFLSEDLMKAAEGDEELTMLFRRVDQTQAECDALQQEFLGRTADKIGRAHV
eukprot:TRINITY_DN48247_c0_g1_i1.p1 TRINITY_DN48247_c0_g1~~TRINITY_DN48247_c0_g1_i1.p1  ORF type:complete len:593 (+),score=139.80 TRINITY_DN48247_c0_g1_i1:108-1886(+)